MCRSVGHQQRWTQQNAVNICQNWSRGRKPNTIMAHGTASDDADWQCSQGFKCPHTIWRYVEKCRSQWPHGLRRRSTAARLLGLWVRIPPGAWMFVCCECFMLSGRGLCDELITRPEESYRLWCVVVCDLKNLMNKEPYPTNVTELNIGDTSLDVFPTRH